MAVPGGGADVHSHHIGSAHLEEPRALLQMLERTQRVVPIFPRLPRALS